METTDGSTAFATSLTERTPEGELLAVIISELLSSLLLIPFCVERIEVPFL